MYTILGNLHIQKVDITQNFISARFPHHETVYNGTLLYLNLFSIPWFHGSGVQTVTWCLCTPGALLKKCMLVLQAIECNLLVPSLQRPSKREERGLNQPSPTKNTIICPPPSQSQKGWKIMITFWGNYRTPWFKFLTQLLLFTLSAYVLCAGR